MSFPSDAQEAAWRASEGDRLLVVGIGASAGGLEALERIVQRLPPDGGLAYVVVQHLSPEHESSLTEILARAAKLPVATIEHGQRLERDHVYVLPPGASAVVEGGALRLVPVDPKGVRLLVNALLTSLAEDLREDAVGVVLSGTGSDGALGIAEVRRHGGRTFAQLPADARYASMPAAAIATGAVEQILPADEIPAALLRLAAERRRHPPESARGEAEGLRQALEAVARATGHDFTRYKRTTVLRRLHRRMAATGIPSVHQYGALVDRDAEEARRLADDLTINVTSFFRDDLPFQVLEKVALPELLERRRDGIRVWVPACSTGEEAYSLAILLSERAHELPRPPPIQVFATDIDASALAEARRGLYTAVLEQQVTPARLARFFTRRGESYSIAKPLRDLCIFTEHDLVRDPPFSRMDLVSCRNLLIYLDPALQKRVIELLHYALRPGGYLLLGKAEMVDGHELELFEVVDKAGRVFRRREVNRLPVFPPPGRRVLPLEQSPPTRRADPAGHRPAHQGHGLTSSQSGSPGVVVDARGEVRYYWGARLSLFVPPHAGPPATNLMHLARRELRVELAAALHNAARQRKPVTYRDMVVEAEGVRHRIDLVVRPIPPTEQDGDELFLVVFEELRGAAPAQQATPLDAPTQERYQQLQRHLESTQERLHVTIEELENANEALRTSNEQLQAMNEEMHSANEELQTSQEELQSVNEELNTLNAELSKKVDELEMLYGDIQNLFQSTQIATIFLDREARIARFTPAATAVFRLAEGDVGRPLSDFAARFDAHDVPEEMGRVLETLTPVERTIGLADGKRAFLMRMHPYRTPSNVIAGVVISFIDVTKLKETEAALRRAVEERERAERALLDVDRRKDEFLAVLSHELRNPLAPIRSSLHVLENAPPHDASSTRAYEIIGRQVTHLARLVDDLLDVTRIAKGKLQVERRPLDLRELAERTAEDHRTLFTTRDVALEVALPERPVWVDGDATRLAQAIGNLLQNAAKFTSGGDSVVLSLAAEDGRAVLRVRDTGLGIEPELLPQLFRPFVQSEALLTRRLGGLGLGLALVRGLVETHGGTIEATSAGKGGGAEFVVRLPLIPAPDRVEVPPPAAPARRRVLVIDDNPDAAESRQMALQLEGHEVALAHDGPQGLERARVLVPEVVLCDIGLPGMDGYAVGKALRREPALRNTLLVALSGFALPEDRRRAVEAGFDAHLAKPASIEAIEEVMRRAQPAAGGLPHPGAAGGDTPGA